MEKESAFNASRAGPCATGFGMNFISLSILSIAASAAALALAFASALAPSRSKTTPYCLARCCTRVSRNTELAIRRQAARRAVSKASPEPEAGSREGALIRGDQHKAGNAGGHHLENYRAIAESLLRNLFDCSDAIVSVYPAGVQRSR